VTGFLVLAYAGDVAAQRLLTVRHVHASKDQTIITVAAYHIGSGEEGAAVISNGAAPFQLIESFHGQVFGQALRQVKHFYRQQTFLQLRARATESGSVDRVDGVDAILDEYTLTPADHLATQTDVAGILTDEVVVIDEGGKQLDTGPFLERMASRIVNIIEPLAAVLGFEIVPVVTADKGPRAAVTQLQIVRTLEDLGEDVAFLVIETTIIRCPGCCLPPLIHPVNRC